MISDTFIWKNDPSAGPIPAHVYYSEAKSQDPRPIALIFHAGGFVLGSTAMIPKSQISSLVNKGFVVVTPEYRLCPQVSLYEGPIQDAKDALRWCQEELPKLMSEKGVEVDGKRVVAMGHSAGGQLALTTGLCPTSPLAIVDFYGCKYFSEPSWTKPLPAFAQIPDQPEKFTSSIFSGPQALTSQPMFVAGKPNLADTRCAWYIQQIKQGTSLFSIVPDGDYVRVDAASQFSSCFPPTYFLHGKPDVFVGFELSVTAHEELKHLGVESVLVTPEDVGHGFDLQLSDDTEGEESFERLVEPALVWLAKHV